ncbi:MULTISPECIES: alkaline phosphatase family protein [Mumia]|uniref:Alkaline phosphatase family protein n=2 Tax=Mumia TaxID=1546255 RepID=A0ABW1QKE7_9ACTN|nr:MULTISPECIES: nucleotide pyrophosphatase/phosphodiesterase family protein [Mumia]
MTAADIAEPTVDYHGRSLTSLLPSIAAAMGVPSWSDVLSLPPADRYVVVLVDGLGHDLLAEHADAAPYLASLLDREPLRSGLPSTTATSLTSLGTGLPPGRHGVVGYTSRIPGTDRVMNSLRWDPEVDPAQWQPHPTMFERIDAAGIPTSTVNKAEFEGTGLTVCSQSGVPFHPFVSVYERLDVVVEASEATPRSLVYTYESTLDHTGHERGCTSPEWRDRLRGINGDLADLRDALAPGTALVVTADHGMLDLPPAGRFDVEAEPGMLTDVTVFAGEARFRHLYTRSGAAEDVAARWRDRVAGQALVLTREEAEAAGWFGPIDDRVRPRIGDVVVAALGDFGVFSSRHFAIELKMAGFHGSVTPAEMRVPLLVDL